jgi:Smr domain
MSQQQWVAVDKKRGWKHGSTDGHVPTLDLHGYTMVPAMKLLVEFLEKHCCLDDTSDHLDRSTMVKVVTGMGSHSGDSGGPVLKNHVNNFLIRHSFQFTFYTKGGYFIIPAIENTGMLNYRSKSCASDSKIVTIPRTGSQGDDCRLQILPPSSRSGNNSNKETFPVVSSEEMPTLQEVVRDETQFQRAVNASIQELRLQQKEIGKEEKLYHRAIETSLEEAEEVKAREKWLLLCAIQESIELSERERDEDDAALKEAIELSEHDCDQDVDLKEAIAASLVDATRPSFINNDDGST